ncbi:hypothetical protein BJ978_000659 [Agromyces terreus]|uniref:Uncharacterized protein n=1 Tax=Agromyces terreus TaxID=424795 RepID=A0A9X2KA44_9MICO|nr:hypothetical protein [Agromyces terreus]MCP2369983.1 hypothetical protein [Agromyces terreus]
MTTDAGAVRLLARVGGPESDQALAVTDAACWVAVLRRPGSIGEPVGTFRAECTGDEADAAVAAAIRAIAASGAGGDVGWALEVDGRSEVVPHAAAVDSGLDAAVDPLLVRALQAPVSAVRLEAHVVEVPGMGAMLGFTFASIGTEATSLRLEADRLTVTTTSGEVVPLPTPTLGLVDADGTLRDGIGAIAELPPGRRATCSLPWAGGDTDGAIAAASGSIELAGPFAPLGVQPFAVSATVRVVPKGALG